MKRCKSFLCALLALTMVFGLTMTAYADTYELRRAEEEVATKGGAGRCIIVTSVMSDSSQAVGAVSITPKSYNSAYYYEAIVSLYVGGELIGTRGGSAGKTYPGHADVRDKNLWNGRSIIVIGQFRTGNGNALYAWDKAVTLTY